jgi:homoserine kinase type II
LAVVLSHYDLGIVESITEFSRGSRRSPKVGIVCQRGKFLLKRRDPERTKVTRMRFAHALQSHLADQGFPLPRLISPANCPESADRIVVLRDRLYELFEYVSGHAYHHAESETRDAGRTLARFHKLTADFEKGPDCPRGDYHDANAVRTGLNTIPGSISSHESVAGRQAELLGVTNRLFQVYDEASERVQAQGIGGHPDVVIHSDWHPGNMLFKNDRVVAVIDYDSARAGKRILDVANGALQFSILTGDYPEAWPDGLDVSRMHGFLKGYEALDPLTSGERACMPDLMIEALIAESVVPIAMTGSFGRWQGFRFMQMVQRKVQWVRANRRHLVPASA